MSAVTFNDDQSEHCQYNSPGVGDSGCEFGGERAGMSDNCQVDPKSQCW